MSDSVHNDGDDIPVPTMMSAVAAVFIAELEAAIPGLTDRAIARLSSDALHAQVIRLRGSRTSSAALKAQQQALLWLTTLRPLLAPARRRRKG